MNQPKITVITASYNAENTIEQTISSVVNQNYPNIEYVIVDGGSTDGTVSVIKEYASSYNIQWISEPDQGLYDALNKGVQMATGDYIEIIGADDALVSADIISQVVREMNPNTDVFAGQVWYVDEDSKKQSPYINASMRNRSTYRGGMSPHAAMFARRELLLRYPFDTSYRIAGDYKFFLQCYYDEKVQIQYSDIMVAFFATSGLSSDVESAWREEKRLYSELGLSLRSYNSADSSWLARMMKYLLIVTRLFVPIRRIWRFFNIRLRWKNHTCTNKICRWCGRMERD
jgi:hypothetical protein